MSALRCTNCVATLWQRRGGVDRSVRSNRRAADRVADPAALPQA